MSLKIVVTPEFAKRVKQLSKKYKNISKDLKDLYEVINKNPRSGVDLGSNCYKIRLANSSIPTGKSGGFRVIIYLVENKDIVRLLYIFSKREQENISDSELRELINKNL